MPGSPEAAARRDVAPTVAGVTPAAVFPTGVAPTAVAPTATGAAAAPTAVAATAVATAASAGAGRDHAGAERCAAVGTDDWNESGGGLGRRDAAEKHRSGQRASTHCTSGGVAH